LSCTAINFEVGINETIQELSELARSVTFLLVVLLVGFSPLGCVFFLRERRGVL
jgi:hypothetical protein